MSEVAFKAALQLFNDQHYVAVIEACQPYQKHPMFALLLATAYGKCADFSKAEGLFLELKRQYPSNLDVLFNFALVLKLAGRISEALSLLQQCVDLNNHYHPAHHAIASIYADENQIEQAKLHLRHAVALQPKNATYLYSDAELDYLISDYKSALVKLKSILVIGEHSPSLRLMAAVCYKLRLVNEMRNFCSHYSARINNDTDVLMYAGLVELDEKCYVKAFCLLQQAMATTTQPCFELSANLLYCSYLLKADKNILLQIVALSEHEKTEQAYYFSVNILETLGLLDDADKLLSVALQHYPKAQQLLLIKAKILTRQRCPAEALTALAEIGDICDVELKLDVCYQKVQIFEAQSAYSLAAEQIKLAGQKLKESDIISGLEQDVARARTDLAYPKTTLAANSRQLIFIIGFPRSGTTLLESKLADVDRVKILEETNAVRQFYMLLQELAGQQNVMEYLSGLSDSQRTELAQRYLASLEQYCELDNGSIIVDKMPLNAVYLAPVLSLFPMARVVLMLRHPMDVCISSLKQRMINLFSVEKFAQSYDCYFSLLEQLQITFPGRILPIKYEQLVSKYQQVFADVLSHCGLTNVGTQIKMPINSPVMFNTPSYHQVSQPIYSKAVNSFKHYQDYFAFDHPLLLSWAKRLEYFND